MGVGIPSTIWGCPLYGLALPEIRTPQKKYVTHSGCFVVLFGKEKNVWGFRVKGLGFQGCSIVHPASHVFLVMLLLPNI